MAFDTQLADRVRASLTGTGRLEEKRMFGGLCFMLDGYMCAGLNGDVLMLRLGEAAANAALEQEHVRPMDFTGKPLRGYVFVDPAGTAEAAALQQWLDQAVGFVRGLPAKR